jgi:hypothetical protein
VIREVEAHDRHAAASQRLMQAFGLRFKQSVILRPHQDVLTAQQARRRSGALPRHAPRHQGWPAVPMKRLLLSIDTPQHEAAVAQASNMKAPMAVRATRVVRWRRPSGGFA